MKGFKMVFVIGATTCEVVKMKTVNRICQSILISASFAGFLSAGAIASEPVAMLDPFKPGLQVTFDIDGDETPVDWGVSPGGTGFAIAGGVASNTSPNGLLDYQTTTKGSAVVEAFGDTEDWVFSCQWQTDASAQATGVASVFGLSGPGGDLVQLTGIADPGQHILLGGNGTGNLVQIGDPISYSNGVMNDLTVHYKSDVSLIDFWSNGVLIRSNVASRTGAYEVDFVRIRGGGISFTDYVYDNILIGPTNPPAPPFPQTIASRPVLDVQFESIGGLDPVEYGVRTCTTGFTASAGSAVSSSADAVLCYQPGWSGTSSGAMLEQNEDWACTIVWQTDAAAPGPTVCELSGPDGDIARLLGTGSAGMYILEGGDGGGGYVQIGAPIAFGPGVDHELTFHYQEGVGLLDFWVDGVKVRTNIQARSGSYRLDSVQLRGGAASATVDRYASTVTGPFGVPADEPGPRFDIQRPGLLVDFNTDGDSNPAGGWGVTVSGNGFAVGGGVATNIGDSATLRYQTSVPGSTNVVALSDTNDWAFSMRWDSDFTGEASTVFGLGAPNDQDIAMFIGTGDPGKYRLLAGDGSDTYVQIGGVFLVDPGEMHILTLQYDATAGLLNFWIDGMLARTNFPSRKGFYNLEFIQVRGGSPKTSRDIFDDVRAGSIESVLGEIAFLSINRGAGDQIVLRWNSASDRLYGLDRTQDLIAGFTNTIDNSIMATPPINTYTDTVSGVDHAGYQVRDVTP